MKTTEQVSEDRPQYRRDVWTCPCCGQSATVGAYGCCAPPSFYKRCLFRDRMIGGQCIAYLNPRKAHELMVALGLI